MAEEKVGMVKQAGNFYNEVLAEMRKVTWPSKNELKGGTAVIVMVCVLLSLFLGLADSLLGKALEILMSLAN